MDCNINNNLWTGQWIKTKITGDTEIRGGSGGRGGGGYQVYAICTSKCK